MEAQEAYYLEFEVAADVEKGQEEVVVGKFVDACMLPVWIPAVFDRCCVKELQLKGLDEPLQTLGVEVLGVGREAEVLK